MSTKKLPVRVRFANEMEYTTIKITENSFKPNNEFKEEVFGWIDNVYVAVHLEDWKKAIDIWEAEEKSSAWNLTVISEKPDGYLVCTPNGDTQYMTKQEFENFHKKRNER